MDDQQALTIVTALANGAHPHTGEVFPSDSPYQSPDVIRALFAAQRALEARLPTQSRTRSAASAPASTGTLASASNPGDPNAGKPNAGKPWSADEDKQLLASFDGGKPLTDIARAHGRTVGGVRARLEKHGRLEPSLATRWPVKEVEQAADEYAKARTGGDGGSTGRAARSHAT